MNHKNILKQVKDVGLQVFTMTAGEIWVNSQQGNSGIGGRNEKRP